MRKRSLNPRCRIPTMSAAGSTSASTGPRAGATIISWFMNRRSRLSGIATGDQAIFVRRQIFEQMGGFSDIPLMEDIEFSRRLKRQGPDRGAHRLRHDFVSSLGAKRPPAHNPLDVDPALPVLAGSQARST